MLLDANENAYGPGVAIGDNAKSKAQTRGLDIDVLGLNRYPDP